MKKSFQFQLDFLFVTTTICTFGCREFCPLFVHLKNSLKKIKVDNLRLLKRGWSNTECQ